MSFQLEIGSLGGTVFFLGETLYPSANCGSGNALKSPRIS